VEPLTRRRVLGALGIGGLSAWASAAFGNGESATRGPALIVLWLGGGPSQIETFDPKPGTKIGGPTRGIATSLSGVEIAEGLSKTAEVLDRMVLVRSVAGQEGDHERASILMSTGFRPDASVPYPSVGAICAHELESAGLEIPRYVSILGDGTVRRGGYFGAGLDPFVIGDPAEPLPDVAARVAPDRYDRRLEDLRFLEAGFAERHPDAAAKSRHADRTSRALATMNSDQLSAFSIDDEPSAVLDAYGRHSFGRGCLAARRLVEVGVRSIEVTLSGWDTHIENFENTRPLVQTLDDGLSALILDLEERELLEQTVVVCAGEFGRTPRINATDGRDHWPDAFSVALAGGRLPRGLVIGETSPEDGLAAEPIPVADLTATILAALGIDPSSEVETDLGRPVKFSDGKPIARLMG
jgi:hypothetical protein